MRNRSRGDRRNHNGIIGIVRCEFSVREFLGGHPGKVRVRRNVITGGPDLYLTLTELSGEQSRERLRCEMPELAPAFHVVLAYGRDCGRGRGC